MLLASRTGLCLLRASKAPSHVARRPTGPERLQRMPGVPVTVAFWRQGSFHALVRSGSSRDLCFSRTEWKRHRSCNLSWLVMKRYTRAATWLLAGGIVALSLAQCSSDVYCQSGPKYGTQCYSGWDVREQYRQQGRGAPPQETEPSWNKSPPPTQPSPGSAGRRASSYTPPPPPAQASSPGRFVPYLEDGGPPSDASAR